MDSKEAKGLNPRAIFSKTGKGVQEAGGKTSHLSRADRAVLAAIDGKTTLSEVQGKFDKLTPVKFDALIQQLDKDGFIREVSSGSQSAPPPRQAAPAAKAPPKAAPPPADEGSDGLDFTQFTKAVPKPPSGAPKAAPVDLAAAARAEAERRAKEQQSVDFRVRQEAEAKAKAEAEAKARAAAAEARARAEAEAKAAAEAEAKAKLEAASRAQADADAKVKAAREAAVRLAADAKAKAEAKAKADAEAAEKDKARLEAELNAKLEAERKAREEAERRAADAAEKARKDLEEKAKRDAEEMRQRLEAEMQAKLEAERKAREAEDRKRREEEDRRRKEEEERRRKEDEERRAKEEAERKRREEEDRKRREEDDRRRKEEAERHAKEEAERKAREAEDRKRREEEDRRRKEEDARRRKEDDERRAREADDRRKREDEDRNRRDADDRRRREDEERRSKEEAERTARAAADAAASLPKIEAVPPPPAAAGGIGDSLLADLDSFGKREEEEQKEREAAERKAREETARREKEEAERKAKEKADEKRREEEKRRRMEEEERRTREEEERREREEEERRKDEEEARKRKAKEEQAAKQATERAEKAAAAKAAARKVAASGDDDIPVTEDDLDADDLKRDQKVAAERARRAAREAPPVAVASGRPRKLGKPIAIALAVLLVVGLGVLNFMPVSTAEYEKAASEAMGVPVKIGSARLSVLTGVELKLDNVTVGSAAKIRSVRGSPEIGSLFGSRKAFSRVELEGAQIAQSTLGDALVGKVSGANFRVERIVAKQLALDGPLKLPPLDVDAAVAGDGTLQTVKITGGDKIVATLSPKGGDIAFEVSAGSFAPPFVPALSLSEFSMKGSANRSGVTSSEFDGRVFDGVLSGTARVRWGDSWTVEGELKARNLKMAVFAPTLVSDGRVDGRAAYSMSGGAPESLYERARVQGEFKVDKGVLGSVDISRALQTGGAQSAGQTSFNEMSGQGVYDKGAMQFSNVVISAGALNAGVGLNIDANGGLSGRIVADVKTASQKQSATLNISGKVQEPVIRK